MTSLLSNESLHFYLMEPVNPTRTRAGVAVMLAKAFSPRFALQWLRGNEPTFAHVLNVPHSEELWPGDAINLNLLPIALFEVSPEVGRYVNRTGPYEHMRYESLRLCAPGVSALDHLEEQFVFDCEFGRPFTFDFSDRCEDEGDWSKPEWLEEDFEPFYYPED